ISHTYVYARPTTSFPTRRSSDLSGDSFFTTDCSACIVDIKNVPDAVRDPGRTWKAYFESMPASCTTTDSALYAHKHNPLSVVVQDRKSTRLNSSHDQISYAVFCL